MGFGMTQKQKSIFAIITSTVVAVALIWVLWPKSLTPSEGELEGELPAATVEGEVGNETPVDLSDDSTMNDIPAPVEGDNDAPANGAKLPAPNSAELVRLHEEALAGNRESLEEICKYVSGADLYDLGDFKPSEELTSNCGEFRPEPEE